MNPKWFPHAFPRGHRCQVSHLSPPGSVGPFATIREPTERADEWVVSLRCLQHSEASGSPWRLACVKAQTVTVLVSFRHRRDSPRPSPLSSLEWALQLLHAQEKAPR